MFFLNIFFFLAYRLFALKSATGCLTTNSRLTRVCCLWAELNCAVARWERRWYARKPYHGLPALQHAIARAVHKTHEFSFRNERKIPKMLINFMRYVIYFVYRALHSLIRQNLENSCSLPNWAEIRSLRRKFENQNVRIRISRITHTICVRFELSLGYDCWYNRAVSFYTHNTRCEFTYTYKTCIHMSDDLGSAVLVCVCAMWWIDARKRSILFR